MVKVESSGRLMIDELNVGPLCIVRFTIIFAFPFGG